MHRLTILAIPVALLLAVSATRLHAQSNATSDQNESSYGIKVAVDEVSLTFHASDAHGMPVDDLKLNELTLLDNGNPPRRIVAFDSLHDLPLRAGIVIDTSGSMQPQGAASRAVATQFARLIMRPEDQAFVMDFGYISKVTQPWTSDPRAIANGIRQAVAGSAYPLPGTALFDSIFRACDNQFGSIDQQVGANFILVISDGEDNAGHTSLEEVVDECQRSKTVIYVFRAEPHPSLFSEGPKALADLASQTGGRVLPLRNSREEIENDTRSIEADLRNRYRLVYNPAGLTHDGSFHRIDLRGPDRVEKITVRNGYYDHRH
jgi:VWFA-related protein